MTKTNMQPILVAIKGAGDLATGVIHRLHRAGFAVMATELAYPTVVRRTVAFAEAIAQGQIMVEEVTARQAFSLEDIEATLLNREVPIVVDPESKVLRQMQPIVLVEATISKYNSGVTMNDAPIVIALGPGYEAGKDVHAVVETNRGHNLGRVYLEGCAEPNTGMPGAIGGYTIERLLRAPSSGVLYGVRQIGDLVQAGETVALVKTAILQSRPKSKENMAAREHKMAEASSTTNEGWDNVSIPVTAAITGILRGLVRDGLHVSGGMKVGDIDPRAARDHCFTISDKSRAIAGGVLEAALYLLREKGYIYAQNRSLS